MAKQTRARKQVGKGKVTPVQVAFIVDRYLSDNNYTETRSTFRTEASNVIFKSRVQEAPKSLLSLSAMLDEYICLKEQKVMMDQEKSRLEQEKSRIQSLLRGMQNVMNVYTASEIGPVPLMTPPTTAKSALALPYPPPMVQSPAGYHVYNTPTVTPVPANAVLEPTNFTTPITNPQSKGKRKGPSSAPNAPQIAKKSRSRLPNKTKKGIDLNLPSNDAANTQENAQQVTTVQSSSPHERMTNGSPIPGSNVVKNLFNHPSSSPATNASGPKTPPQALSSQSDKFVSPRGDFSTANSSDKCTPQEITPTNYTIVSCETVTVSPSKQEVYHSEKSHCISTSSPVKSNSTRLNKRDHVKGRLDFDGSDDPMSMEKPVVDGNNGSDGNDGNSTSESQSEDDFFGIDLPNLDFSISELLRDFDISSALMNNSGQPATSCTNMVSGPVQDSGNGYSGTNQVLSEYSSTVTEVFSEKDMNKLGMESMTAVKSTTKTIKILSPVKNRSSSLAHENSIARN